MQQLCHGRACPASLGWSTRRAPRAPACTPRDGALPAQPSPAASFKSLLDACGADLNECYDQSGAVQVGPVRRALKATSAATTAPLEKLAPPAALAALGVAASQALRTEPCIFAWIGSPEPGDGVASSARRLVDSFSHNVETPPPRLLDVGLILLAFCTVEKHDLLSDDACSVAVLVGESLAAALKQKTRPIVTPAAANCIARLLDDVPPKSEYAQRAEQQEEFRQLAQKKLIQSEKNAEAAARRRLARGDWKCATCGTVNFSDRRVCHMCLEEPAAKPSPPPATKPSVKQQRPQGRPTR
jgi:Zn-finger in Ran binding protein and others